MRVSTSRTDLQIVLWVPVGVEDDAGVCCCEVYAETTSAGTQEEHKAVGVRLTKAIDSSLA